ncbi:MAG: amino acid adenylation domain-containing protein [Gammaproteobacteria bacterium]|nr:amino acid adenylation domain-containing protein [Gammaproteobacteria bacterium]
MDEVVETYKLAPMQEGMLFHALSERGRGVDIEQIIITMQDAPDPQKFRHAWRFVMQRHAILRTRFRWEGVTEPRQEVVASTEPPLTRVDWRDVPEATAEQRFAAQLSADRHNDFDMAHAPLMRLFAARFPAGRARIIWTFHHVLLDGRSFAIVLRELFWVYDALCRGSAPTLSSTAPYRNYIEWRHSLDLTAAEAYWRKLLRGVHAPTPFAVDLPRAEGGADKFREEPFGDRERRLSRTLTERLRRAAGAAEVTLNTMLQAAWAVLLHRYSGESDIVFGATRAGRRIGLPDAENMVGLFINTLPVRVTVTSDALVTQWLQSLRAQQIALRPYEHAPLTAVQAWSDVARGMPLFESVVVYDHCSLDVQMESEHASGRHFEYLGQTNFPLALIAYGDDEMLLRLEYARRRFSDTAVERMLEHLVMLLAGLAGGRAERIRDLDLLTETEREALTGGNEISRHTPAHASLQEGFERQAARTPEAIAIACGTGEARVEFSYAELDRRTGELARHLRALGVVPNQLVGLRTERNADLVIGILGILKAGGAYLPLDPVYPSERIAFMLRDAGAHIVVTQRALVDELSALPVTCVCLDEPMPDAPEASVVAGSPDDLAYVIYTSGSTGQPKGVRITHHNVLRLFAATDEWFDFQPSDVWTLFHSYAFDFSVWELWGALLYGGRVVVVSCEISRDPEAFRELLLEEHVTVLNQTPTAFRQLVDIDRAASPGAFALRHVIFGGEVLELQSLKPWMDRYGEHTPRLINMYGITETTVHVTYRPLSYADLDTGTGSIIGVPIPDLRVYILDPDGRPVPLGVPGEMHIAGAGVAPGYLNRPELTAERFVPDPFQPCDASQPPPRMYRSGDLARRLDDGELEYLGRIDQQVKIRGFRIELGEIEAALVRHEKLRQVAVVDREDVPGDKRLVAYLVAESAHAALVDELREALRQRLPEYMVPAHFVFLDALPLTANGKLDRRALPVPDGIRADGVRPFIAPGNSVEQTIAEVWKKVLLVDRVSIHDHFFELGGDSILSIQVIARCLQRGLRLTPRDLFENPTIAQLAQVASTASSPRMHSGEILEGAVPLTPIQKWFFEQGFEQAHHWNQAFMFAVAAEFDPAAFEQAVQSVFRQHDALRLRFTRQSGAWIQHYGEAAEVVVQRIDLSHAPAATQASLVTEHAGHMQEQLRLERSTLLRMVHFRLGDAIPGRLLIVIHHLAVDGVSWGILLEDLESAYLAVTSGAKPRFEDKTTSMRTWAERGEEFAQSDGVRDSLMHWCAISKVAPVILPADADADAREDTHADRVITRLSEAETRALLQRLPKVFRTRINDVLLSCLTRALQGFAGGDQFRIDLEGHGREHIGDDVDVSRTIGWFTTLFPIALPVAADGDAIGRLLEVRDRLRRIPHRGMSYGLLRYASPDASVRAELAAAPPSSVLFNYLGQFDAVVADSQVFEFAEESTGPWRSPDARRTHALEIVSQVRAGRLEIEWHYDAAVHAQATIERVAGDMLAALRDLLAAAARSPGRRFTPRDFPLAGLDSGELTRLLARYPDTEDIYPLTPMQRLFFAMESSATGLGFEQWQFRIDGMIEPHLLKRAIEHTMARHSILRSAFVDGVGAQPLQVVMQSTTLPWTEEDWREATEAEQSTRLANLMQTDAATDFDLAAPPAMRIALRRVGDQRWQLLWSTHHLYVDGWSWPVVFRDVSRAYAAFAAGTEPAIEAAPPFRHYAEWLSDSAPDSEDFWRQQLRGFAAPTPMCPGIASPPATVGESVRHFAETTLIVDADTTAALRDLARREQVTPNVLMNGAWALLLAHYAASDDVVFGASFSGRPADIVGIESLVGPCVNNIPVRVTVRAERPLASWLAELQHAQFELAQHQYTALEKIQEWARIPWRHRLFDSLIVFQNYRVDADAGRIGDDAKLSLLAAPEATNYPLTLAVRLGDEMRIRLIYQPAMLEAAEIRRFAADLDTVLHSMAASAAASVGDLLALLPAATRGLAKSRIAAKAGSHDGAGYSAPGNDAERVIAEVWQQLFEVERISLDDNFFDLGGHSLLLVRAHALLQDRLCVDLSIVALLQYPTVRSLARHLAQGRADALATDSVIDRARKQREAIARRRNLTGTR